MVLPALPICSVNEIAASASPPALCAFQVTQISDVVRATVVVKGDVKDLYDAVAMSRKQLGRSGGCWSFIYISEEDLGKRVRGTSGMRQALKYLNTLE